MPIAPLPYQGVAPARITVGSVLCKGRLAVPVCSRFIAQITTLAGLKTPILRVRAALLSLPAWVLWLESEEWPDLCLWYDAGDPGAAAHAELGAAGDHHEASGSPQEERRGQAGEAQVGPPPMHHLFRVEKMSSQTDVNGRLNPCRCLMGGVLASVEMTCQRPICIERFESSKTLGRFVLRQRGTTIAVGMVMELLPDA